VPSSSTRPSTRPSTPPPSYFDDDDIPELPGRGGSPLRWLLLIVIVGGFALVATQWDRVAQLAGVGGDPALIAAALTEGDAGIAQGDPDGFANAIEAYGHAVAAGARDVETLAKLSHAQALAAQAQLDDGASSDEVRANVEAAEASSQAAVEADPNDVEAQLARADALRLAGAIGDARELLDGARSMSFSRTPELFRIDALLSAAEAGGGLEHGLRSAKRAAALAPEGITYQLLLARAEIAAGDAVGARAALTTILADHPEHPVATKLLAELDQAEAAEAEAQAAAGSTEAEASADQPEPSEGSASDTAAMPDTETAEAAPAEADTEKAAAEKAAAEKATAEKATAEKATAEKATAEKAAAEKAAAEKKKAAAGAAGDATPKPRTTERRRSPKQTEYDQLVEAASDDAFVDGRPPVRNYEWYMRQGRAELAAGNYSRARSLFDSALEARPGSAGAMDGLGTVFTRIEDFETALRYYRVAAQRGHPDGFFNLGKTYESLGRKQEAVSAYYTYVKRRPKGAHVAVAVSRIKTLEPRAKLPPELDPEPEPAKEPVKSTEPATP
jgi:predicted Zn-dependent protease